jgi:hypothetical protein
MMSFAHVQQLNTTCGHLKSGYMVDEVSVCIVHVRCGVFIVGSV